jgi:tetratricopeptide (TPR) repeat protein
MTRPVNAWMLTWLTGAADLLVGQAPGVAAELLARAVAGSPARSAQRAMLTSRLADALYRVGDRESAERTASQALEYVVEPELFTDLHWTLAQCRMLTGSSAECLATLDLALAFPALSARHCARLLVLAARTLYCAHENEEAVRTANSALTAAADAGDSTVMGWALNVLIAVATVQGKMADALRLLDRALGVTQADQELIDLRLLLQVNRAVALGNVDQYEEALAGAKQASHLAGQIGSAMRMSQAHGALAQLFFETGRWDDALAEAKAIPENLKEPGGACSELGLVAVIYFHRGEVEEARRQLAAVAPFAQQIGHRPIGTLLLARSLDHEQAGRIPEALAVLTAGLSNSEELGQVENLFLDAVRLAMRIGDLTTAQCLADRAAGLASELEVPHRHANALYCRGLLNHDAVQLLDAAERYGEACWPLSEAKALEAAAGQLLRAEDHAEVRITLMHALDVYTSMRADADIKRLEADMRAG